MNRHIQYLKSYQLIKTLYIYAYLLEIYKSYQKYLKKQAASASLAAKEEKKSTENPEPKQKTASGNFFSSPTFSLGECYLKSKTAPRFFPFLIYDLRQGVRFNSVDPIINREEALSNPQLWNLYAYCGNNPITYFDPDGRDWGSGMAEGMASQYRTAKENQMVNMGGGFGVLISYTAIVAPIFIKSLIKKILNSSNRVKKLTTGVDRSGGTRVKILKQNGSKLDITAKRVKEYVPKNTPKGVKMQKVKFKNAINTKGTKRLPTKKELKLLQENSKRG